MSALASKLFAKCAAGGRALQSQAVRQFSAYPIDDSMFGLNDEEIAVSFYKIFKL